ncbi:hypothetical protein DERP_009149, partial [Dermatophagoides pteronyssinus]
QLRLSSGGQNHLSVTTTTLIHSFLAIVKYPIQIIQSLSTILLIITGYDDRCQIMLWSIESFDNL